MKYTLSPRELGKAINVSESSLKRWADDGLLHVTRTAGGHRRIDIAEAIRFIREHRHPVVNPRLLGLTDVASAEAGAATRDAQRLFTEAILAGRSAEARGLVLSMYLSGESAGRIFDGPIAHALHHVGETWRHRDDGIFIEHRATDICVQAVNQLRGLLARPAATAPKAVGGAPAGDPYLLASMMAATVLAAEGWEAANLGPNTPWDVLRESAVRCEAKLMWMSISVCDDARGMAREIDALADQLSERSVSVVIGGRCVPNRRAPWPQRVHAVQTMSELSAFARGLAETPARRESGGAS